ncbi:MAG: alpha/beta fold hydrolase [Alphaproteobacteria bacterium]|nr:alpha/beta fold hydrolase [Alphaproteobacteria bacterium]
MLVIPSLINRYHVLDIDVRQSFVRDLAEKGFRPLLLDWDMPGKEESGFSLDDYLSKRLFPALNIANKLQGGPVHVIGYCMGGLLAAALATHAQDAIRSLMFLATPWDFHADGGEQSARVEKMLPHIEPILKTQNELPVDVLQCFFISLQPFAILDKFLRFAGMKPRSAEERAFVLIEDWVNEGVPLVGKVAETCLQGWYIQNTPANGRWKVLGKTIRPQDINLPSLHVIPQNDKIVPPASAKRLAGGMRQATVIQPEFGHISMMVNGAARDKVWPALFSWLASH